MRLLNSTIKSFLIPISLLYLAPTIQAIDPAYCAKVADAIYWAEGGLKSRRPYGLIKFTVPKGEYRKICLAHIEKYYRQWTGNGDFIAYLASKWAPTAKVPHKEAQLNQNWLRNVRYFLEHPKKVPLPP